MNCVILYRFLETDANWRMLTCGLSGRYYFTPEEAKYKARDLVRRQVARVARILQDGDIIAEWTSGET